VGNLSEDVGYLDGGSGGAHTDEVVGRTGANEHVHADAVGAVLEAVELAHQDGRDGEDHDDFNGDGEAADEGTQGAMDEIADNQFIHASTSVWERTESRIAGLDRQAGSPEMREISFLGICEGATGWECCELVRRGES
jgi:hypothetical protein